MLPKAEAVQKFLEADPANVDLPREDAVLQLAAQGYEMKVGYYSNQKSKWKKLKAAGKAGATPAKGKVATKGKAATPAATPPVTTRPDEVEQYKQTSVFVKFAGGTEQAIKMITAHKNFAAVSGN